MIKSFAALILGTAALPGFAPKVEASEREVQVAAF
jgi:hypothetical protein